jgi:hypothetical protein
MAIILPNVFLERCLKGHKILVYLLSVLLGPHYQKGLGIIKVFGMWVEEKTFTMLKLGSGGVLPAKEKTYVMFYAIFFPVGMGGNFAINAQSTVEQYERIHAISVGVGTTYSLILNQKNVESCPQKDAIFNVIRTCSCCQFVS